MGGGFSFFNKPKPKEEEFDPTLVERRDPLVTTDEVMNSSEGMGRVLYALENLKPGDQKRWSRLIKACNRIVEQTVEEPDPIRLEITEKTLKEICKKRYDMAGTATSDKIKLMRKCYPKLYDGHTFELAKRNSQVERNEKGLSEEMYAYGELDHEIFATIIEKMTAAYGVKKQGIFYDLGCGVGQLVFTAALIGDFSSVNGVEMITQLLENGERKTRKYNKMKTKYDEFTPEMKRLKINWPNENILAFDEWTEATFILLHWTAMNPSQVKYISQKMDFCDEGTQVVSFTHPIRNPGFEILVQDTCRVSWGEAEFFIQEKMVAGKPRPAKKKDM
jgi:SAM-dependent methyltransferase